MPSPGSGNNQDEDDVQDPAGPSLMGDEVESQGESAHQTHAGSTTSWGRWTAEEWRQWNSYYAVKGSGTASNGGEEPREAPTSSTTSANPRGSDPWQLGPNDPWSRSEEGRGGGGAAQDKIQVPEFNGEDDRDGGKAKSYLRKVEAWRRVTRLPTRKQALMLYNNLAGRAWRDAEELELWLVGHRQWSGNL